MKRLNFFPYYEPYLEAREKTTTCRLGNSGGLVAGDDVLVTVGWDGTSGRPLHRARVTAVQVRQIKDLTPADLEGESPDCKTPETTKLVLGCIYRRIISDTDPLYVIKFQYLP